MTHPPNSPPFCSEYRSSDPHPDHHIHHIHPPSVYHHPPQPSSSAPAYHHRNSSSPYHRPTSYHHYYPSSPHEPYSLPSIHSLPITNNQHYYPPHYQQQQFPSPFSTRRPLPYSTHPYHQPPYQPSPYNNHHHHYHHHQPAPYLYPPPHRFSHHHLHHTNVNLDSDNSVSAHLDRHLPYPGAHPGSRLVHHDSALGSDRLLASTYAHYASNSHAHLQPFIPCPNGKARASESKSPSPDRCSGSPCNMDAKHEHNPPPAPTALVPRFANDHMTAAQSVELAILAMADDGADVGKKRDYMVFTRDTYKEMVHSLQHPDEPLGPHITDRRRWRRLMKLLTLHANQPPDQCITWRQSPLWIVAIEDWNELIWSFHKICVPKLDLPGHLGCYSVAKTARLLGREFQTRRSRCGIFIEYINHVLMTCPMCGIGRPQGALVCANNHPVEDDEA